MYSIHPNADRDPSHKAQSPVHVAGAHPAPSEAARADAAAASSGLPLPPVEVDSRVHFDAHLLLWQVTGMSDIALSHQHQMLRAGHLMVVPAGVRHSLSVQAGSVVIPLLLRLGLPLEHLPLGTTRVVNAALSELLLALIQHESDLLRTTCDLQEFVVQELLGKRIDNGAPKPPTSREASRVANWLLSHPEDEAPLASLSTSTYVSQRTVERQFRAETGLTPLQWRMHNRLAQAADLLGSGVEVRVTAARVGYTDLDAFRRAFKKKYGLTPRQFRQKGCIG